MKNLLKTFGLFAILSIVFSGFSACSSTTTSQKSSVEEKTAVNDSAETAANSASAADKSSEYPPVPEKVAQAEFKTLEGEMTKVENFKGSVVLLNLWATWCGPCRKEMPELIAMENEFKANGFKVIGLNVDSDETSEQIESFAEDMKLNYQLARADENLYRELLKVSKFNGIPQSFLVDRQGHLRGVFLGGSPKVVREMRENVEKVVNEM